MVKAVQNLNGSAYGTSKGFSFLELVIVVAIVVILAAIALPQLTRKQRSALETFLPSLNVLVGMVQTNAQITGKLHRIMFDFKNKKVIAEAASDKKTTLGEPVFEPLQSHYLKNFIAWPQQFEMNNFYIKDKDELRGGDTSKVWFYISPDGITQQISLTITDTSTDQNVRYILNPFTAQFKKYGELQTA